MSLIMFNIHFILMLVADPKTKLGQLGFVVLMTWITALEDSHFIYQ